MAYGIVEKSDVNREGLTRSFVHTAAVENGQVFNLNTISATTGLWSVSTPATGALTNLWMAASPEHVLIDGKYSGLSEDPRDFILPIGGEGSAFQPRVGEVITLSADAVGGTKSTNTFVVATDAEDKLQWAAAAVTGLSLKLVETTTISIGMNGIGGTHRVVAYKFNVVAV